MLGKLFEYIGDTNVPYITTIQDQHIINCKSLLFIIQFFLLPQMSSFSIWCSFMEVLNNALKVVYDDAVAGPTD
jgi:hypothetical protein